MKKLAIFGLALVLVFGMSAMTLAGSGSLEENGTVDDEVQVNVNVDKWASFSISEETVALNFTEPGTSANTTASYTLKSNTPVTVDVQENLSSVFANKIGDWAVWANSSRFDNSVTGESGVADSKWIVSPNAYIADDVKDGTGNNTPDDKSVVSGKGIVNPYDTYAATKQTGNIVIESEWREKDNGDTGWWNLNASENYNGKVTVTVSAK